MRVPRWDAHTTLENVPGKNGPSCCLLDSMQLAPLWECSRRRDKIFQIDILQRREAGEVELPAIVMWLTAERQSVEGGESLQPLINSQGAERERLQARNERHCRKEAIN